MRRFMVPIAVLLMVAAAVAVLIAGPRFMPDGRAQPAGNGGASVSRQVPVLVEAVVLRPERSTVESVGTARARQSVTLYPAATGEVVAVNFTAGQAVKAGSVLVELDSRAEEVQLELARVRLANARREFERAEQARRAISAAELDAARTAVRLAQLEVRSAEVALADRSVKAPFDGHIGITDVDPGDRIGPDTAIATLDDRAKLLVSFEIPELFLGRLKVGDPITVASWTAEATRAEGEIFRLGTRVDPQRRTFVARASIDNPDDDLRPGMSFRVRLQLDGRRYPVVPEVSLQWGDNGAFVWTLRDGRAQRVPVTLVQRERGQVLVDAALDEGALVVTEGVQAMREGLLVEVLGGKAGASGGGRT